MTNDELNRLWVAIDAWACEWDNGTVSTREAARMSVEAVVDRIVETRANPPDRHSKMFYHECMGAQGLYVFSANSRSATYSREIGSIPVKQVSDVFDLEGQDAEDGARLIARVLRIPTDAPAAPELRCEACDGGIAHYEQFTECECGDVARHRSCGPIGGAKCGSGRHVPT